MTDSTTREQGIGVDCLCVIVESTANNITQQWDDRCQGCGNLVGRDGEGHLDDALQVVRDEERARIVKLVLTKGSERWPWSQDTIEDLANLIEQSRTGPGPV